MKYHVTVGKRTFEVDVGEASVRVDGKAFEVDFAHVEGGPIRSLRVDGASHTVVARREGKEAWELYLGGHRIRANVVDERTRAIREMTGSDSAPVGPRPITAPMPGLVVRVEVTVGDVVREGQGAVIVEAMKMENELTFGANGVVTHVHVTEGQVVEKDQVLIDLGPLEKEVGA